MDKTNPNPLSLSILATSPEGRCEVYMDCRFAAIRRFELWRFEWPQGKIDHLLLVAPSIIVTLTVTVTYALYATLTVTVTVTVIMTVTATLFVTMTVIVIRMRC